MSKLNLYDFLPIHVVRKPAAFRILISKWQKFNSTLLKQTKEMHWVFTNTKCIGNSAGLIQGLIASSGMCFSLSHLLSALLSVWASFSIRLCPECSSSLTQMTKFAILQRKQTLCSDEHINLYKRSLVSCPCASSRGRNVSKGDKVSSQ